MSSPFADLLGKHLQRTHTSVNRLAILSGVPQRTIANWLSGYIRKPRQWQSILQVALVLHLSEMETSALLQSAGYRPVAQLMSTEGPEDQAILAVFRRTALPLPPPFQAISDLPTFVGRSKELKELHKALRTGERAAMVAIKGMGGVGKTALAAHLAYQLREEFPDGVLWARLDTSDPLSILSAFADAFNKDVSQYKDVESRAAVVRNLLQGKRVLIVLDNAESSSQIRPLLPPSTGVCAVLVTTRSSLSILNGWKHIRLEPFDSASKDVIHLFERYLGQRFGQSHRVALWELAALLGNLPLALAIAAGLLARDMPHAAAQQSHEARIVTSLLETLRSSATRLGTLQLEGAGIHGSLDVSYLALTETEKEMFGTLGIFSGEDFGADAVAYLADQTPEQADTQLRHLSALSLVQKSRSRRWRLHPLLQDYARERLTAADKMTAVVEKMLRMVQQAAQGEWRFDNSLHAEIPNIRFALEQAHRLKLHQPLIQTVRAIYPTLYHGAWYLLAKEVLQQARQAAHALDDVDADIYFVKGLANTQMALGDIENCRENLHLALQLSQSANRDEDVAEIYMSMGKLEIDLGYWQQARLYSEACLEVARKIHARETVGMVINNIAMCLLREARYAEAEAMYQESLEIVREYNNTEAIINALMNLGEVANFQEKWEVAFRYWQEGLSLARTDNHRLQTAALLSNLSLIHTQWRQWDMANQYAQEAVQLAQEINSPRMEGAVRGEYGGILYQQKNYTAALEQLAQAKELAESAGDAERKGLVLFSLGLVYLDLERWDEADSVLDEALVLARQVNYEVLTADIYFAKAKVSFACNDLSLSGNFAGEALKINQRFAISQKIETIQKWQKLTGILIP